MGSVYVWLSFSQTRICLIDWELSLLPFFTPASTLMAVLAAARDCLRTRAALQIELLFGINSTFSFEKVVKVKADVAAIVNSFLRSDAARPSGHDTKWRPSGGCARGFQRSALRGEPRGVDVCAGKQRASGLGEACASRG